MRKGLSLRIKLLSTITMVLLVLVVVQYYVARTALINGFDHLEADRADIGLSITRNVIEQNLLQIAGFTQDYAFWDDAIAYVEDQSEEFIESNLNPQAFNNIKINVAIITNAEGKLLFARSVDWMSKTEMPMPQGLIELASENGPLWRHKNKESFYTGIVLIPEGPVLVTSYPILDSNGEGEVHGMLLMGRYLNENLIGSIANTTKIPLKIITLLPPLSTENAQLRDALQNKATVVNPLNNDILSASALLNDILGNPTIIYSIEIPRDLYSQALATTGYLLGSSLVVFVIIGLISLLFDRLVLQRIVKLTKQVSEVGSRSVVALSRLPRADGGDELGHLTESMNSMLERIENNMIERQRAEDRIYLLAHYDQLTRLPNRALLNQIVQKAIDEAQKSSGQIALFFLDLDRFKNINDSLGHDVGDELLIKVADRLRAFIGGRASIARLGGDEFVIVLPDLLNIAQATAFAQRLVDVLNRVCMLKGQEVNVSTSIGISIYPDDGIDMDTLLRNADTAMYHAKENGRNNYVIYDKQMNAHAVERLQLESSLSHAIQRNELVVHYQPVADLMTGQIISAEALTRWNHPEFGAISPSKFIPIAEETGLIHELGEWVLRTVCQQLRTWLDHRVSAVPIAINISAKQMQNPHFYQKSLAVLAEFNIPSSLIIFELTESTIMADDEYSSSVLPMFRAAGIHIAMDDFGTGFSSFSRLHQIAIDILKIDRSFIWQLGASVSSANVIKAIIKMAKALNIRVIAEGVETEQQAEFLRQNDCDAMQGFYFSKPQSAIEFGSQLRNQFIYTSMIVTPMTTAQPLIDPNCPMRTKQNIANTPQLA